MMYLHLSNWYFPTLSSRNGNQVPVEGLLHDLYKSRGFPMDGRRSWPVDVVKLRGGLYLPSTSFTLNVFQLIMTMIWYWILMTPYFLHLYYLSFLILNILFPSWVKWMMRKLHVHVIKFKTTWNSSSITNEQTKNQNRQKSNDLFYRKNAHPLHWFHPQTH